MRNTEATIWAHHEAQEIFLSNKSLRCLTATPCIAVEGIALPGTWQSPQLISSCLIIIGLLEAPGRSEAFWEISAFSSVMGFLDRKPWVVCELAPVSCSEALPFL